MKKFIILLLAACMLLSLNACTAQEKNSKTVNFYYPVIILPNDKPKTPIAIEKRNIMDLDDPIALLNTYLQGPLKNHLTSPFPASLKISDYYLSETRAYIHINDEFNNLKNLDYTIACSCLSLTVLDYSQALLVQINIVDDAGNILNSLVLPRIQSVFEDTYIAKPSV